ncbi:MAG: hypothetical protein Q4B85_01890 [Lachnospiraceae bacterium]|nr:hypothetical protein [Lachnospiraceae bacterium]
MKKTFILSVLCASLIAGSTSVYAASTGEIEGPIQQVTAVASDGRTRASWGYGTLTHANPIGRKPWAYATSSTYNGNCNVIKARVKVESGGETDYTSWAIKYNSPSAPSATIIARTETNVTFYGLHDFQDTSASGWQHAITSARY